MNSELLKKLTDYRTNLEKQLGELKTERQAIIDKVNAGQKLSMKENKRNQKIATLISDIEEKLRMAKMLRNINGMPKLKRGRPRKEN